ncbi:OmpA family protein [Pseudocolwellia agarivorans]|uniref:OmpA family protein n=1 Tax=Pseudocolwellia agarivorans TaxID=1911682 RepID=UPI0009840DA0|nr:OmpA family protein [Pseudocolwellia agarivorans]
MKNYIVFLTVCLTFAGCASKPSLKEDQAIQKYLPVSTLKAQLANELDSELDVLSPKSFAKANELYSEAMKLAKADNPKALEKAKEGLKQLAQAKKTEMLNRDVLEEVLSVRAKAIKSKASAASPEAFAKAEKQLLKLTKLIENGDVQEAKEERTETMRAYAAIELASIKVNIVDAAKVAIENAKKKDIDDLAPRTMKLAQEDYQLALNTLDADRRDTEKANGHAQRAIWNVERAVGIAEVITHFRQSDYEEEDKVLWYQEQVTRIVAPIEQQVAFDGSNKVMVKGLNSKIQRLVSEKDNVTVAMTEAQERNMQIAKEKEQALAAAQEKAENEKRRNDAITAKFKGVQSLFNQQEADVYRQGDNVLIRAHGFSFKSGNSEIDASNFALLNKITKAISAFPNSNIVVSGHTDNRGSDEINLKLSTERGNKVANFLSEVGQVESGRVESTGYGKSKPVASNDSVEGRAANRRVEILIVNNEVE